MKFKETPNGVGVVCRDCNQSFAYIENGQLVILTRHQHRTHSNMLTAGDLRKLAEILDAEGQSCAKINDEAA